MQENKLTSKKANAFTRIFWSACGAEIRVLEQCGDNDRVKYFCLGGIVIATGFLAGIAGGYAFYTIFEPKSYALGENVHVTTAVFSFIFGILWGGMIFNLDRYIVASSGIGDGTEKITWSEFTQSLPRLLMGIIIAITISKPLEIRIFKSELDNAVLSAQLAEKSQFSKEVNERSSRRRKQLDDELAKYNNAIAQLDNKISKKEQDAENERLLRGGRGVETNRLEKEASNLRSEKRDYISNNASRIQNIKNQLEQINLDVQNELSKGDGVGGRYDGLLLRLKLSHEIAGWYGIFISLLILVIELTPIFFKMMSKRSNYDNLLERYKNNTLISSELSQNESMRQLQEKIALQKEVFDKLVVKYREDLLKEVDEDYKSFIVEEDIKVKLMPDFAVHQEFSDNEGAKKNNKDQFDPRSHSTSEKPASNTPVTFAGENKSQNSEDETEFNEKGNNESKEKFDYTGPDFKEK